jgi:hypothetical protein
MTRSGYDAIEYAVANGLTLNKYADPIEDAREGLSVAEARKVASEDPNLIYVTADKVTQRLIATWNDGQNPATDEPIAVRWNDDTPATMADFARIDGSSQSDAFEHDGVVEFSYRVE